MRSLDVFTSHAGASIRVAVDADGIPWFVIADIARELDLTNPTMASGSLELDDLSTTEVIDSMGRKQVARTANEAGLYQLIFQSRKPEAKQFRRWVTHDVLPAIRRTGHYGTPALPDLSTPEGVLALAQTLTKTAEELVAAKAEITVLVPKADAWEDIASGDGDYSVGDAAKMLQRAGIVTGRDRLFETMRSLGWVYRQSGRFHAAQRAVDAGRLRHKAQSHRHPETGETVLDAPQVRVTMKGVEQLRVLMLEPIAELVPV